MFLNHSIVSIQWKILLWQIFRILAPTVEHDVSPPFKRIWVDCILAWGRGGGGVCEFFRVSFFGEWLERPNICRLQSREVKPSKNQKIIEKYWKTKKLGGFSWRGSGKFWIFCPWKSLKTYKEIPLYTPYRLRKCTFSDHQKNLYRARKRICEYRTVLKTS